MITNQDIPAYCSPHSPNSLLRSSVPLAQAMDWYTIYLACVLLLHNSSYTRTTRTSWSNHRVLPQLEYLPLSNFLESLVNILNVCFYNDMGICSKGK